MPENTVAYPERIRSYPMINNQLINPAFLIWERYTPDISTTSLSFSNTVIGYADEWWGRRFGAGAGTVARRSDLKKYGDYSMRVIATTADATNYLNIIQSLETAEYFEDQWMTFSLWVHTSVADAVFIRISDRIGGDTESVDSDAHTGSGDWEQLTVLKKVRPNLDGTGWGRPHEFPLRAEIIIKAAGTHHFDGAVLAPGEWYEGAPFAMPDPAQDLTRAQRFFITAGAVQTYDTNRYAGNQAVYSGDSVVGNTYVAKTKFPTRMQATPSITTNFGGASAFGGIVGGTPRISDVGVGSTKTCTNTATRVFFQDGWYAEIF